MSANTPAAPDTPPAPAPAPDAPRPARNTAGVVSLIALAIALLTAGYVLYRDPPGGRLAKYNFSSPENALRSETRIRADGDISALIELERKMDHKDDKEQLATLEVKRTAECEGRTALFISFKATDREAKEPKEPKEQKEVMWFERQESGYWRRVGAPRGLRTADPQLAKDIDAWSGRPGFQMPAGFGE